MPFIYFLLNCASMSNTVPGFVLCHTHFFFCVSPQKTDFFSPLQFPNAYCGGRDRSQIVRYTDRKLRLHCLEAVSYLASTHVSVFFTPQMFWDRMASCLINLVSDVPMFPFPNVCDQLGFEFDPQTSSTPGPFTSQQLLFGGILDFSFTQNPF